jgi:hypothetical protein
MVVVFGSAIVGAKVGGKFLKGWLGWNVGVHGGGIGCEKGGIGWQL